MLSEIGKRIHNFRKQLSLNQHEIADKAGISRGMISLVENGSKKPPFELICTLIYDFEINPNWLFFGKGDMLQSSTTNGNNQVFDQLINSAKKNEDIMDFFTSISIDQSLMYEILSHYFEIKVKRKKVAADNSIKEG